MKRAAQMQPPIDRGIEIRVVRVVDRDRAMRVATILQLIMDKATTPGEGRKS